MRNPEAFEGDFAKLTDLAKTLTHEATNEAETRLRIVDGILQILGWPLADFKPETATQGGGYTDYLLTSNQVPLVVVEAKRIGRTFCLPDSWKKSRYKASFLLRSGGEELKDALKQAATYCNETGTQYAVVTNGAQWVIFRGLAQPNASWTDFSAYVYRTPDELRRNFIAIWNLLSKQCVLEGALDRAFAGEQHEIPQFVKRPNDALTTDTRIHQRVDRGEISSLFDLYFDGIVGKRRETMLEHCFVNDPDLHEYERALQALLKERQLSTDDGVTTKDLDQEALFEMISGSTDKAKVVLIVGKVGVGKTTFLNKFFGRIEEEQLSPNFILDLLPQARPVIVSKPSEVEIERLSKLVLENISDRYFKRKSFGKKFDPYNQKVLKQIYVDDWSRLRRGARSGKYDRDAQLFEDERTELLDKLSQDSEKHLPRYMRYVSSHLKRNFCLVFDNLDQASDEYQKFVYHFARGLAEQIEGVVIVSLRDTTFQKARRDGFLDTGVSDIVFQVHQPNLRKVISRRLKFLERQIERPNEADKNVRGLLENFKTRGAHLKSLLLEGDNTGISMLQCLANGSTRKAFELLRLYGFSPLAWRDLTDDAAGDRILTGLMLGNSWVYDPGSSRIFNVFETSREIKESHLLKPAILGYLSWVQQKPSGPRRDGKKAGDILTLFESWGFTRGLTSASLNSLLSEGLVETDSRMAELSELSDMLYISASGHFYLHELASSELYKVFCAGSTYWYSEELFEKFLSEYQPLIELTAEEGDFACELPKDATRCRELWDTYLSEDRARYFEKPEVPGTAWRTAVLSHIDRIASVPSAAREGSKVGPNEYGAITDDDQLMLFDGPGRTSNGRPLELVLKDFPELPESLEWESKRYVPRVLWCLELRRRCYLPKPTAAEMAKFLFDTAGIHVHNTNLARFFRSCRNEELYTEMWSTEKDGRAWRYHILSGGISLFEKLFGCHNADNVAVSLGTRESAE